MAKMDKAILNQIVTYNTQLETQLKKSNQAYVQLKTEMTNLLISGENRIRDLEFELKSRTPTTTSDELRQLFSPAFLWERPIDTIKLIRQITGGTLLSSKRLMEELRSLHPRDVDIERAKLRAKLMDARTNDE